MKDMYLIEGMTCQGCVKKVETALKESGKVEGVSIKLKGLSEIDLKDHTSFEELKHLIASAGDYAISKSSETSLSRIQDEEKETSWLKTYWPIILIFFFVSLVSGIVSYGNGDFLMNFMRYFMAGFFIAFSFFKFLDIKGFAEAYQSYDLLASAWKGYGFIYPFIELGLGILYLTGFSPPFTYIATIALMGFSSIGVIRSVLNKTKIKCACLGTVFNLPMSTVTIIEDLLMVFMAAFMLFLGS